MEATKITTIMPDVTFNIIPFPVLKALKLERKINLIFLPAVSGFLDGSNFSNLVDSDINLGSIFNGFISGLEKLSDQEYENLIIDLTSSIQVESLGQPAREMNRNVFEDVFKGNLMAVYMLLFEVMKVNRFSFLELLGKVGGIEAITTNFSDVQKKSKKK